MRHPVSYPNYIIVGGLTPSDLASRVNVFWAYGYRPHMGVLHMPDSAWHPFVQAMTLSGAANMPEVEEKIAEILRQGVEGEEQERRGGGR